MTLDQIKGEAAKLSPEERLELADWLGTDNGVSAASKERLRHQIKAAEEEIARGEFTDLETGDELRSFFDQIEERGLARLKSIRKQPAA